MIDESEQQPPVKIEYRSMTAGMQQSSLSALDLIAAGFMLSLGGCLIWFCLYVLIESSPPDGLRLIVWLVMLVIGAGGLAACYSGIKVATSAAARERRRAADISATKGSDV